MSKRRKMTRMAKKAYRAWGMRAVALVLTVVMCAEAMLGNGVSIALAQGIDAAQTYATNAKAVNDANVVAGDASDSDENGMGGGISLNNLANESADGGTATDQSAEGTTGTTGGSENSTPQNSTPQTETTPQTGTTGNTEQQGANGDVTTPGTPGSTDPEGNGTPGSDQKGDQPSEDAANTPDQQDDALAERTDVRAWEGDLDALDLSSTGLTVNDVQDTAHQAVAAIVAAAAAEAAASTPAATDGANDADAANAATGETAGTADAGDSAADSSTSAAQDLYAHIDVAAKLNLTLKLDAAKTQNQTEGVRTAVIPGDTLTVNLPAGITPADATQTFDVYQRDAEGNAISIKIADAKYENGALKLTFVEPKDGAGATYVVGAEPTVEEGQSAPQRLGTLNASIDMDVVFPLSLAQADATQLPWTLQVKTGVAEAEASVEAGTKQEATLTIPARTELDALVGVPAADATADDSADEATPDETLAEEDQIAATNNALTAVENALNAFSGRDGSEETTYSLSGSTNVSLEITWCDNNYGSRPTAATLANGYNPQFKIGDGEWIHLFDGNGSVSPEAREALHLGEDEVPSWATTHNVRQTSVNTYIASASDLPTLLTSTTRVPVDANGDGVQDEDEHGNPVWQTKGNPVEQSIAWRMDDTNTYPDEYQFGDNDDVHGEKGDPHRYLMLTSEVTFTVEGKIGDEKLSAIFKEGQKEFFQFGAKIDNKDQGSDALADVAAQEGLTITDNGTNATITGRLPMYSEDGDPIVYYITYTGPSPDAEDSGYIDGTDYFQVSYNNSASANHGSATDALYEGGTMVLRRMGTTTYDADKVWLDGGNKENRPATTFTLWRYANNGTAGATTASHVQLDAIGTGEVPDSGVSQNSAIQYVSVTLPAGSNDTVDLGSLLYQKYGESLNNLPKYDPDGYPYVYALREEGAPAGYEIVYGKVGEDGAADDTAPNYEKADYTNSDPGREELQGTTRPDNDPFVYNGGTITNRLTGNKEASVTKTWEIAAFQDDLENVEITFKAQSRVMGKYADDNEGWSDVSGEHATHTEGGWKSETLTRTFSETFPKYNAFGEELEYRWVESGVKQGDKEIAFTPDANGGGYFELTLPTPDNEGTETLQFTSTFEAARDEDGTDTITNTFENTTTEYVEKWWQQPDGSMEQIKPDPNGYPEYPDLDLSGNVTFGVYQDGELVGTFTMDGTSAKQASPLYKDGTSEVASGLEGATWQETASYDVTLDGLPKYSPEGKRYSYVVLEDSVDGWHTDRIYDAENHLTKVENTVGPGEGSEIRVMKNWVDGDDAAHRQPVVVQLVVTDENGIRSEATNDDGTPKYEYAYGETVTAVSQDNKATTDGQIVLSADNSWFAEVEIPIGHLSYKQFKLVEVGLLQDDGTINPVVDSPAQADEEYGADTVWGNVGWDYDDTKNTFRVANEHHVYETSAGVDDEPQRNDLMRAVTVSNRRIGLLDLTITKLWRDGGDAESRPDARIELSCIEYADAFSIDGSGNVWVQVSDNRLPVTIPTGEGDTDRRQMNAMTDKVSLDEETDSLVMEVDSSAAATEGTYHFFGLPKYDAQGAVVHYDVNEQWVGEHEGYTSSKTTGEYVIGTQHFHDTQEFNFTNTRTGTRDVTFYKHWNDQYVNDQLKQRPDIYLTLYRVTVTSVDDEGNETYSAPAAVDGYVRWLWEPTDTDNPQYEQKATIHSLPAYDGMGREYIYYASESMAVEDTASLDYAPVTFSYASLNAARLAAGQAGESYPGGSDAVWIGDGAMQGDPLNDGTSFAIHEDGTFVNALTGNLTATGTKLWTNVPGNVHQAEDGNDLPGITIYLQRKLASDAEWPDLYFTVDESGNWSFVDEDSPGAVAWTSHLVYQTNNQYSYTLTHVGENGADPANEDGELLARYDANGEQYQYRAIEVPWGMCNQPGGFDPTNIDGENISEVNFADLHDTEIDQLGVIVIEHGETGSFRITNVYDSPTGSLTVKKLFSGREAGDFYPSTTFDVYRYYVNDQGVASEAALVASHTLTNDELSKVTAGEDANPKVTQTDNNANNTAEYTFSGLDIYAPDGSYWQYYVVERAINGYTTTVGVGNLSASEVTGTGTDRGETVSGISSPNLCGEQAASDSVPGKVTGTVLAEDKVAQDGTVTPSDTTPDVTFKNEYKPEEANLAGTKSWIDYDDIFGVRPSLEEFKKNLKVERVGNGTTVDITNDLQGTDASAANYFAVTQTEGSDVFTIKLSKVEKWAPDGTAWQYRITETLGDMVIASTDADSINADDFYKADNDSSAVSANSTSQFRLTNRLYGQANVEKTWNDGNDPYGLRPTTVTVRLQARTTDGTTPGTWTDAYELLSTLVAEGKTTLDKAGLNDAFFSKELTANNGWKAAWQNLPAAAMRNNAVVHLEYRVVETKIGDIAIDQPTDADTTFTYTPDNGGAYHPYTPEQTEWTNDPDGNGSVTKVKNTLDATSISATKTWANDTVNGTADAWGTRPTSNGTWSVTYLLQVRLKDADPADEWQWLMVYGAEQATIDDPKNGNIVSKTITGSTGEATKVANWENLPKTDAEGKLYEYRVVERVPGGYDVTDKTAKPIVDANGNPVTATIGGVKYRYYVVDSTNSAQSFTNTLRIVRLTGTKAWEDYGTDIAPEFNKDNLPQMTLYRSVNGGNGQKVTYLYNGGQPEWAENNGTWTYTYENLPAADKNDNAYTYWAEETAGSVDGFYPTYGAADAAGTTVTDPDSGVALNPQKGTTITNVATKLTLAKVSDWPGDTTVLRNIELSILSKDGKTTYAVWTNGDDGNSPSARVWLDGTTVTDTDAQGYKDPTYTTDDGSIVGLPAGDYLVRETGAVPDGYALAADVAIHINTDGSATQATGVSTTTQDGIKTIVVTVTDPVFRGHVELAKTVKGASSEPLAGAEFELWRKGENGNSDVKIAEGITTGTDGKWASKVEGESVNFLTTEDGKRTNLSDGLLPGTYYFLEVDSTPGAWQPSGDEAKFEFTIEADEAGQPTNHLVVVDRAVENEDFSATVVLHKFDATDGAQNAGIDDVEFTLSWKLEDGATGSRTVKTANGGTLTLSGLQKGDYTLKETANAGYDMTDPFTATFTIDNDNYDAANNRNLTYDITDRDGDAAKAIDFTVTGGADSYDDAHGIGNERLRGSVTIEKVSTESSATKIDGATFELQRKNGSDWTNPVVVATSLKTGMNYAMNEANTALDGTGTAGTIGCITVRNLEWGTYRFVETAPAGGYLPVDADGDPVMSGDLVVGRTSLNPSLTGDKAVTNTPVSLELNKQNEVGGALDGAVFTVTPKNGSTFADGTKAAQSITSANGGHAALTAQLVVGGTYEIKEEQAPAGYDPADATFQVTVQRDGSLAVVGGDQVLADTGWARLDIEGATDATGKPIGDGQPDNQFSFIATNRHLAIDLTKVSADDPTVKIAGAQFRLTGPVMDDGDLTHDFATANDGMIHIECGLQGGTIYELSELAAPAGYVRITEKLRFKISDRGEIEPLDEQDNVISNQEDMPEGWTVNDNKISLIAADEPVKLSIQKVDVDDANTKLDGAEFTVTPINGSKFATEVDGSAVEPRTITTEGAEGAATMTAQLMVGGTYTIEEAKAPAGYTKIDGTLTVTVLEDGSLQIAPGTTAPEEFLISGDTVQVFTGTVTNSPTELQLAKVDATTNQPVNGASFSLTGTFANGSKPQTLVVTDNGTVSLDKALLIADGQTEYTLTETAPPEGYETIQNPFVFTVAEDGTITPKDATAAQAAGWTVNGDGINVRAADAPVEIDLVKVGADTGDAELSGAQFLIKPAAGFSFANPAEGENESGITVTPETIATELKAKLVVNNTYTIEETLAPAGYEKNEGVFTFTVQSDGTLTAEGQTDEGKTGYRITDNGLTITATDHPVEIDLVKNGSDDKSNLDGAVFEVYADETVTGTPITSQTTANGMLSFDKLTANATYTLHEKTAPAGYELMPDVTFTVSATGSVIFKDAKAAAAAGYSVNEENGVVTITAVDQLIEVSLDKLALDGATTLDGAVFELKPTDGNAFADGSTEAKPLALEGSSLTFSGLVAGASYTLTETTAPEGYEFAGSFTFTVDADGTITAAAGQQQAAPGSEGYRIEDAGDGRIAIAAQDSPIEIELKKRAEDENDKALAGAVFKVTPAAGSTFANDELNDSGVTLTASAADGSIDTARLDAQLVAGNSYVIEEVTAPAGYEKIAGMLTFSVDADGTIAAATGDGITNDPAFAIDTTNDVMTITATDKPVEIALNKVSSVDGTVKLDATFKLTGIFAAEVMDGTADATETTRTIEVINGVATLDRLIVGNTYVLQETKSQAGYEVITGTLTFTVNPDGTVTAVTADGSGAAIANDPAFGTVENTEQITAANTPVQITVSKVDEGNKPLEGAEFTLTGDMAKPDGAIEANHTWPVAPGTDPATIDGLIVTNGDERHEYTLTETAAPAGYEKLGSFTFTINPDGTIEGTGTGYTVDGNGVNITAQDTAIKARLMKTDENGNPQAGATFSIEPVGGSAFADGKTEAVEFTTGSDGSINLTDAWLVGGNTYTIREVTAPNGYELAGSATFTVNEDGTITLHDDAGKTTEAAVLGKDGSGSYLASVDGGTAVITATNSPIAVQLIKVSGSTPLAGATFELTPAEGSTFADGSSDAQPITFTAAGVTALANLKADATYTLKETVPPAGYELNPTEFTFTVAEDGTITPTEAEGYTVTGDNVITITADDKPIELTLAKQNVEGDALDGAEFKLHGEFANADGTPSGTASDRTIAVEDGTAALDGLIAGKTYELTETKAPDGYRVIAGAFTFTVGADGTMAPANEVAGYAITADAATGEQAVTIAATDEPTELSFLKLATDGETPLAGAEFTIAPDAKAVEGSRFLSGAESLDFTTLEDGTAPVIAGELIAGNAYVLTEIKAPAGYELIAEPLHFTMDSDGRGAQLTEGYELPTGYELAVDAEAGTIAVTALDEPIELTLQKQSTDGKTLEGAKFTITGTFADGTSELTITVGAEGTVELPQPIVGETYTITETKAPAGYDLIEGDWTFTVNEDGTVTGQATSTTALFGQTRSAGYIVDADGVVILAVDAPTPLGGDMPHTGDSALFAAGVLGIFALVCIAGGLELTRRKR